MWIRAEADAVPLWEGELQEMPSEATAGDFRQQSRGLTASAGSPGVVSIGRPQVFEIASLYERGKMPPAVTASLQQADVYLVRLSCSFRPERGDEIDWARFEVSLQPTPNGSPFAVDLHPLLVEMRVKRNLKVGIKADLKFDESPSAGAEYSSGIEYTELVPSISAAGVGESAPSWDYSKTTGWRIVGSKLMHMIVRAPRQSRPLIASFALFAEVGARRFRILVFGTWENAAVLENVQLWPPSG
jgi:hypothetical protein